MKRLMLGIPEGIYEKIQQRQATKNYSSLQEVIRELIREGLKTKCDLNGKQN